LDRKTRRARSNLFVADARWGSEAGAFGRAALDASNGQRGAAPFSRFFAHISPSKAQSSGVERQLALGQKWTDELARDPREPLAATWTKRLTAASQTLRTAVEARATSVRALEPHHTSVVLFIDDINLELDRLEGELKKRFPMDPGRVASYLSPSRPTHSHASSQDGAHPSGPAEPHSPAPEPVPPSPAPSPSSTPPTSPPTKARA